MPPKGDRSARIAAAVERSKTEYQSQHAYTERDEAHANWLSEGSGVGNGMGGKYGLEYVAARAYNLETSGGVKVPEGGEGGGQTLDAIWERVDKGKPLGGLSKEVLDSAMVIAVRRGDSRAGELADLSKSCVSIMNLLFQKRPVCGHGEIGLPRLRYTILTSGMQDPGRRIDAPRRAPLIPSGKHLTSVSPFTPRRHTSCWTDTKVHLHLFLFLCSAPCLLHLTCTLPSCADMQTL
jgi:hypothetical protein